MDPILPPQVAPQPSDQITPEPMGLGMTQEEMRASLNDLMELVSEKYRELDSKRFAMNNSTDAARKQALVEALKALQEAGIDVNDPMAVQAFADMLQQQNPEMYAMFEAAFNALLGDEFPAPEQVPEVAPFSEETPGASPQTSQVPLVSPSPVQ